MDSRVLLAASALVCVSAVPTVAAAPDDEETNEAVTSPSKIVIAHRGASGYLPEHTLPAYALAHGMGADFIEPDLVLTRDGHLICLHDIYLQETTNAEQLFPDRARDDGRWYAADFTLDEIRRLQAEERLDSRFPKGASRFAVPAFTEMIELVQGLNGRTGRAVGIYPELKAPAWHRAEGCRSRKRCSKSSAATATWRTARRSSSRASRRRACGACGRSAPSCPRCS